MHVVADTRGSSRAGTRTVVRSDRASQRGRAGASARVPVRPSRSRSMASATSERTNLRWRPSLMLGNTPRRAYSPTVERGMCNSSATSSAVSSSSSLLRRDHQPQHPVGGRRVWYLAGVPGRSRCARPLVPRSDADSHAPADARHLDAGMRRIVEDRSTRVMPPVRSRRSPRRIGRPPIWIARRS